MYRLVLLTLLGMVIGSCSVVCRAEAGVRFGARATVLLFVGSHCPCSDPHRALVAQLVHDHAATGVRFYTVFSNRGETTELAQRFMRQTGWDFATIIDTDGTVQSRYHATTTPEAIVLNAHGNITYRGAIDDSASNMGQVLHPYLRTAVEQVLANQPVIPAETHAYGCYIVR